MHTKSETIVERAEVIFSGWHDIALIGFADIACEAIRLNAREKQHS